MDEAFLDVSGRTEDPPALADEIRRRIKEETGLTASIGIGPNKLLAKIASGLRKPDAVTEITADGSAETLRKWVRRAETDDGLRPGLTSDERQRLRTLEREVRELRRANETSHALDGQAAVAVWVGKAACSL